MACKYCKIILAILQWFLTDLSVQTAWAIVQGIERRLELPDDDKEVIPGIQWGNHAQFFTPAYWKYQHWAAPPSALRYKLATTFEEEITLCLLGGHGIPAEMAVAAFHHLQKSLFLIKGRCPSPEELCDVLSAPIDTAGRTIHYRFPKKRGEFLAPLLSASSAIDPNDLSPLTLRNWLMSFRGVGYKTASWIVRNWCEGSPVAVLDIHVIRAGLICGLFSSKQKVPRDYEVMEKRYLHFAACLGIDPAELDVLIWQQMRQARQIAPAWLWAA